MVKCRARRWPSPVVAALAAMLRGKLTRRQARGDPQRDKRDRDGRRPRRPGRRLRAGLINPVVALGPGFVGHAEQNVVSPLSFHPISPARVLDTRTSEPIGGRGSARLSRQRPRRAPSRAAGRRDDRIQPHHPGSRDDGSRAGDAGRHRGKRLPRRSTSLPGRRLPTDCTPTWVTVGTSASSTGPTFRSMPWSMSSATSRPHPTPRAGCSPDDPHSGLRQPAGGVAAATSPVRSNFIDVGCPTAGGPDLVPAGHGGCSQHRRRRAGCERAPARNAGRCCSTAVRRSTGRPEPTRSRTVRWWIAHNRTIAGVQRRDGTGALLVDIAGYRPAAPGTCGCRRGACTTPRPTAAVRPGGARRRTFRLAADRSVGRWDSIANTGVPRGRWPWRTT